MGQFFAEVRLPKQKGLCTSDKAEPITFTSFEERKLRENHRMKLRNGSKTGPVGLIQPFELGRESKTRK